MTTKTKCTFTIEPSVALDDSAVINQLPSDARTRLGDLIETGYHLGYNRRDLFFSNGVLQYRLGEPVVAVSYRK